MSGGARRIERTPRRALGERVPAEGLGGGSDHAPFRRAGIPVGGLFTGASEDGPGGRPRDPCYHRRCDTIDNVDRTVLLRMARRQRQGARRAPSGEVEDQLEYGVQRQQLHALEPVRLALLGHQAGDQTANRSPPSS